MMVKISSYRSHTLYRTLRGKLSERIQVQSDIFCESWCLLCSSNLVHHIRNTEGSFLDDLANAFSLSESGLASFHV